MVVEILGNNIWLMVNFRYLNYLNGSWLYKLEGVMVRYIFWELFYIVIYIIFM